jgi:hypothetical protein
MRLLLSASLLLALASPGLAQSCPAASVIARADSLVTEANRRNGPRKTVVDPLARRIKASCVPTDTVVTPPPPPPDPVALPTPSSIAPGSTTAPGPVLSTLTPTFTWSSVSGATGYIVAVRDIGSGSIIYPSSTGVGTPHNGTSFTLPAGVLAAAAAYKWDVTAVSAATKSLASADRYFSTAAPAAAVTITLTPTCRDTINANVVPTGHWCRFTAVVRSGTTVLPVSTNAELTWSVSDSVAVTEVRETPSTFEVHSPTRTGPNTIRARWTATGTTAVYSIYMIGPTVTPPPVDTTTPAPLPTPGTSIAELPRVLLNFTFPTPTRTVLVAATGLQSNLQAALDAAQCGDEIVLPAGVKFVGNFRLPAKGSNCRILVRSDRLSQLPPMGTRVTPAHASLMPTIESPNYDPAIQTVGAAHGWWLAGLEITIGAAVTAQNYGLVLLGSTSQTTLASVPSDLVLDRVYVHGQTTTQLSRCVSLNSARSQITDSWLDECHGKGFDSQAIWGGNGPGPYKIVNNYLAGAGENVMFGGGDPAIPGLVPSDIEFRRNYVHTPISWKGVFTKKNLFELKNASRVLIEANVLDGSWPDGQDGESFVFKSTNQNGGCRWCRTTDVTVRRNLVINTAGGINLARADAHAPVDTGLSRVVFSENVFDNVQAGAYVGGNARGMSIYGVKGAIIERTLVTGALRAAMFFETLSTGCQFRDLVMVNGAYGVTGTGTSGATNTLQTFCPGFSWTGVQVIGSSGTGYPTGTVGIASESASVLAAQIRALVTTATLGVR